MKRISVQSTVEPRNAESPYSIHRSYRVDLGNGGTVLFRSRRDAKAYMAETQRWLSALLLECNALHAEAYAEHRMAWPLYADARCRKMADTGERVRESLLQAEQHMDRASVRRSELHHPWNAVHKAISHTADAFAELETWWRYKSQGVARWRCAMRLAQCQHAMQRMQEYGHAPAYGQPMPAPRN